MDDFPYCGTRVPGLGPRPNTLVLVSPTVTPFQGGVVRGPAVGQQGVLIGR